MAFSGPPKASAASKARSVLIDATLLTACGCPFRVVFEKRILSYGKHKKNLAKDNKFCYNKELRRR